MMEMVTEVGASEVIVAADRVFERVYRGEDAIKDPLAFRKKRKPVWRGR